MPIATGSPPPGGEGAAAAVPADTRPGIAPSDPLERAIRVSFASAVSRIQEVETFARAGTVEGIHRIRTSCRRLRSELRAYRRFLDPEWADPIQADLKWLAGLLGGVRDLDVLTDRLRKAAGLEDAAGRPELAPLFEDLAARHATASRELQAGLRDSRYRGLLASLKAAALEARLNGEASTPCGEAMPPLVARSWRRLRSAAAGLEPDDPDAAFHEVRKRAKQARYTAELVSSILGRGRARQARRFIRQTTRIQDVLGEHQDAVVAADELEKILGQHRDDKAFTRAGRDLLEGQLRAARRARATFFDAWDSLDHKKLRRWFKSRVKVRG